MSDRPTRVASAASVASGLCALLAASPTGPSTAAAGGGFLLLGVGLHRGSRPLVSLGSAALLAGGVLVALAPVPAVLPAAAVGASVLAWDAGGTAIDAGRQLGRDAETAPLELVHVGASSAVVALAVAVGYALFRSVTGARPVVALLALVTAALLVVVAVE